MTGERVLLPHAGHCFQAPGAGGLSGTQSIGFRRLAGNSLETIRQMVASGLGITVMPSSAVTSRHLETNGSPY